MGKKQHTNTSCNISVFLNSTGKVILGYLLRYKNALQRYTPGDGIRSLFTER